MAPYDPKSIEEKWQKKWEENGVYAAHDFSEKPKYYALVEFPYPSGDGLHTGHVRSYTAMDIIARKRRMDGFNVLYPIGWDAFGLPTENYAIKTGIHPKVVTKKNTDTFRRQLKSLGFSFDWAREINTTDPAYYRWTQWIFLQLYKKGLAYKENMAINWCPSCKIGLANEEVVGGKCERCGTPVEKREKEQWMLAITKYADRLLKDLGGVDYLEKIKTQQVNWIGKSEGAEIDFAIAGTDRKMTVFTTRPDTLFGATYAVVAPEHPLIAALGDRIANRAEIEAYARMAAAKSEEERIAEGREKTGVEIKGVKAVNPANNEEIPVFVADYVLATYGTGAIMAVPAHDERDFAFAEKFGLPIRQVVAPHLINSDTPPRPDKKDTKRNIIYAFVKHPAGKKFIALRRKDFPWLTPIVGGIEEGESAEAAALREIREETGYVHARLVKAMPFQIFGEFYVAHKDVNRAVFSQSFLFELDDLEREPVSEEEAALQDVEWIEERELDMLHPLVEKPYILQWLRGGDYAYTGGGVLMNSGKFDGMTSEEAKKSVTELVHGRVKEQFHLRDWVFSRQHYWGEPIPMVFCEKDGMVPVPESDLPVLLPEIEKYQPTDTGESPLAAVTEWVKVTCPACGGPARRETDTMPNWAGSSWYFLRYTDPKNDMAPADPAKLKYWMPVDWYNGGMEHTTLHLLYSRFWNKFLNDIGVAPTSEPYTKRTSQGMVLGAGGEKMSKSKGNVVNPDSVVAKFGADVLRIYEMFMGPFDQAIPWDEKGILGAERFLKRFWNYAAGLIEIKRQDSDLNSAITDPLKRPALHRTIKKVGEDIESMKFNTAVSSMMILLNELTDVDEKGGTAAMLDAADLASLIKIVHPFAPHMAQELWARLGHDSYLDFEPWPQFDPALIAEEKIRLVLQVNSRTKDTVEADADISEEDAKALALANIKVKDALAGAAPKRIVYVEKKLVNIVI
jgi:leucyl-tRNA synthetase